jgi:hypothetical protein
MACNRMLKYRIPYSVGKLPDGGQCCRKYVKINLYIPCARNPTNCVQDYETERKTDEGTKKGSRTIDE